MIDSTNLNGYPLDMFCINIIAYKLLYKRTGYQCEELTCLIGGTGMPGLGLPSSGVRRPDICTPTAHNFRPVAEH